MYAVISTGGKQYRVKKDETLRIEKIDGQVGDTVSAGSPIMIIR